MLQENRYSETLGDRQNLKDHGPPDLAHMGVYRTSHYSDFCPPSEGYVGYYRHVCGLGLELNETSIDNYMLGLAGIEFSDGAYRIKSKAKEMILTYCMYNVFDRSDFRARYVVQNRHKRLEIDKTYQIVSRRTYTFSPRTIGTLAEVVWREMRVSQIVRLFAYLDSPGKQVCGTVFLHEYGKKEAIKRSIKDIVSLLPRGSLAGVREGHGTSSSSGGDTVRTSQYRNLLVDALVRLCRLDGSGGLARYAESLMAGDGSQDYAKALMCKAYGSDQAFVEVVYGHLRRFGLWRTQSGLLLCEQVKFLVSKERPGAALAVAKKAVGVLPQDFDAWYLLSLCYVLVGDRKKALVVLNSVPLSGEKRPHMRDVFAETFLKRLQSNKEPISEKTFLDFFPEPEKRGYVEALWKKVFVIAPHMRHPTAGLFYAPLAGGSRKEVAVVDRRLGGRACGLDFMDGTWGRVYDLVGMMVALVGWRSIIEEKRAVFHFHPERSEGGNGKSPEYNPLLERSSGKENPEREPERQSERSEDNKNLSKEKSIESKSLNEKSSNEKSSMKNSFEKRSSYESNKSSNGQNSEHPLILGTSKSYEPTSNGYSSNGYSRNEQNTKSGPNLDENTKSGPKSLDENTESGPKSLDENTKSGPNSDENTKSGPNSDENTKNGPTSNEQKSLNNGAASRSSNEQNTKNDQKSSEQNHFNGAKPPNDQNHFGAKPSNDPKYLHDASNHPVTFNSGAVSKNGSDPHFTQSHSRDTAANKGNENNVKGMNDEGAKGTNDTGEGIYGTEKGTEKGTEEGTEEGTEKGIENTEKGTENTEKGTEKDTEEGAHTKDTDLNGTGYSQGAVKGANSTGTGLGTNNGTDNSTGAENSTGTDLKGTDLGTDNSTGTLGTSTGDKAVPGGNQASLFPCEAWLEQLFVCVYEDWRTLMTISAQPNQQHSALEWGVIGLLGWSVKYKLKESISSLMTSAMGAAASGSFDYFSTVRLLEIYDEFVLSDHAESAVDLFFDDCETRFYSNKLIMRLSGYDYEAFVKTVEREYLSLDFVLLCIMKLVSWNRRWGVEMPSHLVCKLLTKLVAKHDVVFVRAQMRIVFEENRERRRWVGFGFSGRDTVVEEVENILEWLEGLRSTQ